MKKVSASKAIRRFVKSVTAKGRYLSKRRRRINALNRKIKKGD